MDFEGANRQIASMKRSLNEPKALAHVPDKDASLFEPERIGGRKIENLESARENSDFENIFFADFDEDDFELQRFR